MLEALSATDIDRQHLELLPARTVMSIFMTDKGTAGSSGNDTNSSSGGASDNIFTAALAFLTKMAPLPK
jgi:hypothetical protein